SLDRSEVGYVHDDLFARLREGRPVAAVAVATVELEVDEVGDDLDPFGRDPEVFDRLAAQEIGDGGDAVGLVDGEARDRLERGVLADQCDVRAVQGRDEAKIASAEHLARDPGGRGVGDRV